MATPPPPAGAPAADDLLLKVTPPRVPRHLVTRSRLLPDDARWRDQAIILVQAPAGFGKTSLLAQWRREHLAHGAVVAWVMAQPQDGPDRLVRALALAVRVGAGRPGFGHTLTEDEQDILDAGQPKDIDAMSFFTMINQLHHGRDHLLLCICNSGRRSLTAASLLRSLGYPKALSVAGGFQAWKKLQSAPPA